MSPPRIWVSVLSTSSEVVQSTFHFFLLYLPKFSLYWLSLLNRHVSESLSFYIYKKKTKAKNNFSLTRCCLLSASRTFITHLLERVDMLTVATCGRKNPKDASPKIPVPRFLDQTLI